MCWWGEVLQRFEGRLDNDTVEVAGLHERLAVCTALGTARWGRTAEGVASVGSIHCDVMAQRRDEGVLAVAPQRRMSMRGLWRACGGAAGGDGAAAIAPGDAVPKRARH